MSLYNILFGMNSQSDLLLAVIGFRKVDVERFRDCHVQDDGKTIAIYTRTGGGNRDGYPQVQLYRSPLFARTEDDDFDSTYATFYFNTPPEFVDDVRGLSDILANGLRKEFVQHIAKTLIREPTEADKATAAHDAEALELARTKHFNANGHTFVPLNDTAMEIALKLAEANNGELRSASWGILPLTTTVKRDFRPSPNAKDAFQAEALVRVETDYDWKIDDAYWEYCLQRYAAKYPVTMQKITVGVERQRESK